MGINFKSALANLRGLWIYSLSFIVLFDFVFLKTFSSGGETSGMFIIVSFVLMVLTIFLFFLTSVALQLIPFRQNLLMNAILLFLVSEISMLIIIGNVSLFGLFETHHYKLPAALDTSLLQFRQQRDFSLSISSLLSCVIYCILSLVSHKKDTPFQIKGKRRN